MKHGKLFTSTLVMVVLVSGIAIVLNIMDVFAKEAEPEPAVNNLVYVGGLEKKDGGNAVKALPGDTDTLAEFAEKNGRSLSDYPSQLVKLYSRNKETETFVKNYIFAQGYNKDSILSEEEISGETPHLLLQFDERWGYEEYSAGYIADAGCGPTCLSMVLSNILKDRTLTPAKIAEFASQNDYVEVGSGTKWTLMSEGAETLGLGGREIPLLIDVLTEELQSGNPVIAIMGPGDFTQKGHYIVITGIDNEGNLSINDPFSKERSSRKWNFNDISDQIRNLWAYDHGGI